MEARDEIRQDRICAGPIRAQECDTHVTDDIEVQVLIRLHGPNLGKLSTSDLGLVLVEDRKCYAQRRAEDRVDLLPFGNGPIFTFLSVTRPGTGERSIFRAFQRHAEGNAPKHAQVLQLDRFFSVSTIRCFALSGQAGPRLAGSCSPPSPNR